MTIAVRHAHHHGLTVRDLDRTVAFFRDLLGAELEWEMTIGRGQSTRHAEAAYRVAMMLLPGGLRVELFEYASPPPTTTEQPLIQNVGTAHLCIRVADIDDALVQIEKYGAKVIFPPREAASQGAPIPGARFMFVEDPSGIPLELIEYPGS